MTDHMLIEDLIARYLAPREYRRGLVPGRVELPDENSFDLVDSADAAGVSPSKGEN